MRRSSPQPYALIRLGGLSNLYFAILIVFFQFWRFIQIKVVPLHTESDFPLYNMSQNHNIFTTKQGKKQTNQTLQQPQKSWFQSLIYDK